MNIIISFLPVLAFLAALFLMDSYKLLKPYIVLITILFGVVAAVISYFIQMYSSISGDRMFLVFGPLTEELLKLLFPLVLLKSKRVAFIVDSAIVGFASGAGFALMENLVYLMNLETTNFLVWIVRGLGTAVMHGGTVAIFMIITVYLNERKNRSNLLLLIPGFVCAVLIHGIFNHLLVNQVFPSEYITAGQLVLLPLLISFAYQKSEESLRSWMEEGLETTVELLNAIRRGEFSDTRAGQYVYALREHFSPEVVVDIFCYLQIFLELSAQAKANLLLQEQGFPIPSDPNIDDRFRELKNLSKNIGKTGQKALAPILNIRPRDLWQLYYLESKEL